MSFSGCNATLVYYSFFGRGVAWGGRRRRELICIASMASGRCPGAPAYAAEARRRPFVGLHATDATVRSVVGARRPHELGALARDGNELRVRLIHTTRGHAPSNTPASSAGPSPGVPSGPHNVHEVRTADEEHTIFAR